MRIDTKKLTTLLETPSNQIGVVITSKKEAQLLYEALNRNIESSFLLKWSQYPFFWCTNHSYWSETFPNTTPFKSILGTSKFKLKAYHEKETKYS